MTKQNYNLPPAGPADADVMEYILTGGDLDTDALLEFGHGEPRIPLFELVRSGNAKLTDPDIRDRFINVALFTYITALRSTKFDQRYTGGQHRIA